MPIEKHNVFLAANDAARKILHGFGIMDSDPHVLQIPFGSNGDRAVIQTANDLGLQLQEVDSNLFVYRVGGSVYIMIADDKDDDDDDSDEYDGPTPDEEVEEEEEEETVSNILKDFIL